MRRAGRPGRAGGCGGGAGQTADGRRQTGQGAEMLRLPLKDATRGECSGFWKRPEGCRR